jgi:hypothetical protein
MTCTQIQTIMNQPERESEKMATGGIVPPTPPTIIGEKGPEEMVTKKDKKLYKTLKKAFIHFGGKA